MGSTASRMVEDTALDRQQWLDIGHQLTEDRKLVPKYAAQAPCCAIILVVRRDCRGRQLIILNVATCWVL